MPPPGPVPGGPGLTRIVRTGPKMLGTLRNLVPPGLRAAMRDAAATLALPTARGRPARLADRVTIAGYLSSPSGLGEGARLHAAALARLGLRVGLIDLTQVFQVPGSAEHLGGLAALRRGDAGGPLLLHLNPPNLQKALLLNLVPWRDRPLIAHWFWELDVMPPAWRRAYRLLDEIWAPTRFVATALAESGCATPVRVVPPPVAVNPFPLIEPAGPARVLRILAIFAYDSGFDRKNPIAAVAAFRQAFGDRTDVELMIKTRGRSASGTPERRMADAVAGAPNIRVESGTWSRADYLRLLGESDVLLSLHRSEGFGLILAEAMMMGKPVIATAWSGNLDFMPDSCACLVPAALVPARDESDAYRGVKGHWADPSVPEAAAWLRRLAADPALRRSIGEAGRDAATRSLGIGAFDAALARSGDERPDPGGG